MKSLIAKIALLNGDRGKRIQPYSPSQDFKAIKEVHEETNISIESLAPKELYDNMSGLLKKGRQEVEKSIRNIRIWDTMNDQNPKAKNIKSVKIQDRWPPPKDPSLLNRECRRIHARI